MFRTRPSHITLSFHQEVRPGTFCPYFSVRLSLSLTRIVYRHMYFLILHSMKFKRPFTDLLGKFPSTPFRPSGQSIRPLYGNSRTQTDGRTR